MDKRLYLIDGHALIFKMYYAFLRRPMINSKGADMSILFGFTKYILELIEKEKPTHLAVAFDPPGGTFRHEMFPEYKGTRDETPQLVIDSLEPLVELCGALKIPVLMEKGFEADDVIGSVAKRAEKEGFDVFMVTPDKDYGQLISEHIFQLKPGKSGGDDELIDTEKICSRYKIDRPEQVIEILTLCGDTADNVPGVKGVGEVGAGKLIGRYGTVDNIYSHLSELTQKQREAFEKAEGYIRLSHELVTIKTDMHLSVKESDMEVATRYGQKAAELFDYYEFGSLRRHLGEVSAPENTDRKTLDFVHADVRKVVGTASATKQFAIVTETRGQDIFSEVKKVTIAAAENGKCYVAEGQPEDFMEILSDTQMETFGYDLKFQSNVLANHLLSGESCNGGSVNSFPAGRMLDIELMHYLLNPEKSHKIETLARTYLGVMLGESGQTEGQTEGQAGSFSLFDEIPETDGQGDRMEEAAATLLLGRKVLGEIQEQGFDRMYFDMEEPLLKVLAKMEREGVRIDVMQLRRYADSLAKELADIQNDVRGMADEPSLNIMSPKQIGAVIYEKMKLDPKMKPKSGVRYSYPTDEDTLTALADKHPIIDRILEYRGVKKLLSTYIEPLPGYISETTGKIHTTFNQALTATGRLSSSKPNLQNIPVRTDRGREIRKAFVPSHPDGLILSADYSQIELRLMAHLSGDTHLTEAFRNGQDVHAITASKIFKEDLKDVTADQRRIAKTANFGIMYGISAFGLSQRLKISRSDAKKIIDDYFENFPAISSYIDDTIASAKENGYVETLFGRRRYLPDITSRNATVRSLAERNAVNAPIQGTSADIIKLAMVNVDRRLGKEGLRSRMILQIHDELVFDAVPQEVEKLEAIVREEMENVIELSIPLTVECNYGKNWLEAH